MKKVQRFTLTMFLVLMVVCASLFVFIIWSEPKDFGVLNKLVFTLFVSGLASFLFWIVTVILDIKEKIEKR